MMKCCSLPILGLCLGLILLLAPTTIESQAPNPEIVPDVVYAHKLGMALTFDVFKPEQANGAGILFMVSGGWISRWYPPEQAAVRLQPFLDRGFTVFAIRHGSSPRFKVPEAVADVRKAVHFIRENAADYGVDQDRLGVHGSSAGGHLSLMLGLDPKESGGKSDRVAAIVAYFPPVDLRTMVGPSRRFPALDFDPELAASISPILFVSADDPPTLLIHGNKDRLVPLSNSEKIHAALQEQGVATDILILEGAGHGFRGDARDEASEALLDWFETHLTGELR